MERRLGRGLGSLLGSPASQNVATDSTDAPSSELPVEAIRPNSQQPRVRFDEAALESLRDSISLHGVIQAIAVRKVGDGYELISGERRLKAAKMAGLDSIPAVLHEGVATRPLSSGRWLRICSGKISTPLKGPRASRT